MIIKNWQILALASLLSCSAWASSNVKSNGKTLFEQGKYEQAFEYFKSQQENGHSSKVNTYNMAVSLYRLKRFNEAKQLFLSLTRSPDWRPLADYNLGLVARATGDADQETHYFRLAARQTTNGKIRSLALARLGETNARRPKPSRWIGIIRARTGYDSNAARLADDLMSTSDQGADRYMEWLGFAQTWLIGRPGEGIKFYGLAFDRRYHEFHSLDTQVVGGNLSWEHPVGAMHTASALRLLHTQIGRIPVDNELQASFSIRKFFADNMVSLSWLPSRFYASAQYHQVNGSQQRIQLMWKHATPGLVLSARYRFETNDRADLTQGSYFSSYSPTRNDIKGQSLWRISPNLQADVYLDYQHSDYRGVDSLKDTDGQVKTAVRKNNRLTAGSWLDFRFFHRLSLRLEYAHIRSDDTYNLYAYTSSRVTASLEYSFL